MAQNKKKEANSKQEDTSPPRLSIAERFMSSSGQREEDDNTNDDNEITDKSMVRSSSGLSRLLSFNILSTKASESRLSLGSVSIPPSDVPPVTTKFEPQPRYQRSRTSHHCHCQCNPHTTTTPHFDLEKSKPDEDDQQTTSTRQIKRKRRTICVIVIFVILIAGAISVYLTWPRTPLIRIDGASLLDEAKISETRYINAENVAFESTWQVEATIDSRQNYIPLSFTMETIVKDSLTGAVIGHQRQPDGDNTITLPARAISNTTVPIHIDYEARVASDPTFASLRRACVENSKEALQLQFWITIHIAGLEWIGYKPSIVATPATGGLPCPTKKV
ncbi:hypothetical protein BJV82DRAFT_581825 [Fennellomyces sp. T-0311]|nr:hypothetical protein BJV82DRAFT_581825 [Fennellomyces sp. T-0311]